MTKAKARATAGPGGEDGNEGGGENMDEGGGIDVDEADVNEGGDKGKSKAIVSVRASAAAKTWTRADANEGGNKGDENVKARAAA
ncbi:hypothetical protein K466DRAFT_603387 [Polyporus arcularius HHB13444]|uniref:Uncharacterized protein n=1 Tax=Polyporus arcularius HHB13444 TaxID=1314778 RepID=A0A5C3NZM5_9APHY|nr:hypothetical protein K466DRAFT_603387 [Polyporus arcularius HHB13444]